MAQADVKPSKEERKERDNAVRDWYHHNRRHDGSLTSKEVRHGRGDDHDTSD